MLETIKENKLKTVRFTIVDSCLGKLLLAATEKGICSVRIGEDSKLLKNELTKEFHSATLIESSEVLEELTTPLINYLAGNAKWPNLPYDIESTPFQRKVWNWLRTIPPGRTYTYSEVAKSLGQPTASRAVARACATNPAALVIPCHRIVPKSGGVGGFRWDPKRKKRLLELESIN